MRAVQTIFAATRAGCTALLLMLGGCGGYDNDDRYRDRHDGETVRREVYYEDEPPPHYRDDYYDRGRYRHDYRDRDYYERDRDYDRDRDRDDGRDPNDIPRDASLVANGNQSLSYTCNQMGRIYVRDEKSGKVIYSGRLQAGQKVSVDPGKRGVAIDGRTVKGELDNKPREREVYFRPDRGVQPTKKNVTPVPGKTGTGSKKSTDRVIP